MLFSVSAPGRLREVSSASRDSLQGGESALPPLNPSFCEVSDPFTDSFRSKVAGRSFWSARGVLSTSSVPAALKQLVRNKIKDWINTYSESISWGSEDSAEFLRR